MDKRKHVDVGELEKLENYLNNEIEGGGQLIIKGGYRCAAAEIWAKPGQETNG